MTTMMMFPPTVETNEEFKEFEKVEAHQVEKFDLLMRSIRVNHKLNDNNVCIMCLQELPYLVYTRQVACHFKKRYDELKQQQLMAKQNG